MHGPELRRSLWVLGAGQCVYWGILYYAFAVLLVPMRSEFGTSDAAIAGAFSLGLAVSALLAPTVGQLLDRGHGIALMRGGALAVAGLLWAWSAVRDITFLYLVWCGLGAAMALVLYEAAFALITRAVDDGAQRLRALASVTVIGGLASTLFVPIIGSSVAQQGWRSSLHGLALVWLLTTLALERWSFPALRERPGRSTVSGSADAGRVDAVARGPLLLTALPFVLATLSSMALTTLVIPMLHARGYAIDTAALVLAGLGVMQLPGRLWLLHGGRGVSPQLLLTGPLLLQALGLGLLGVAPTLAWAFAAVAVFGIGAGLHTLARPWVVPQLYGVALAGRINGAIARAQGVARAIGPFAAAAAYGRVGSLPVFTTLALALLLCCPVAQWVARRASAQRPAAT